MGAKYQYRYMATFIINKEAQFFLHIATPNYRLSLSNNSFCNT